MTQNELKADIQKRYLIITKTLENLLPEKAPVLAMTNSKNFWGRIRRRRYTGELIDIRISVSAFLELYKEEGYEAYSQKLTQTITHELAHITHWTHDKKFQELHKSYHNLILIKQRRAQVAAAEPIQQIASTSLNDLVNNPQKARAALRKAGIAKPGSQWKWEGQVPEEVQIIIRGL